MNFRILSICIVLLGITLSGVFGFTSHAQAQVNNSNDIIVGLLPENPKPNQTTLVTIESYSIDLNSSKISWYRNEKLISQGVGLKKTPIQTGALGSETTLRIRIDTPTETFTKTITLIPASVSINWEARTYTPPFYKGKALFTHQSNVIFVASPNLMFNGQFIPKENLVYTWTKNGTVLGDQSGYGKYTLSLTGSIISRSLDISVSVQDSKSGVSAFENISLDPKEPEILMYKNDPLYGTQYQKALSGTIPLISNEITLEAIPYYFSTNNTTGFNSLLPTWSINGTKTTDNNLSLIKTFRKVGDNFGISNIGLSIQQNQRILQFADKILSIDFTKEKTETKNP